MNTDTERPPELPVKRLPIKTIVITVLAILTVLAAGHYARHAAYQRGYEAGHKAGHTQAIATADQHDAPTVDVDEDQETHYLYVSDHGTLDPAKYGWMVTTDPPSDELTEDGWTVLAYGGDRLATYKGDFICDVPNDLDGHDTYAEFLEATDYECTEDNADRVWDPEVGDYVPTDDGTSMPDGS